mmetsp:Transcript_36916/g.72481  ORF Transcript_36916/g.72481 Transcript_36916/m.72481 type:complete len:215 (-) Transcript_36916:883-1527(-)
MCLLLSATRKNCSSPCAALWCQAAWSCVAVHCFLPGQEKSMWSEVFSVINSNKRPIGLSPSPNFLNSGVAFRSARKGTFLSLRTFPCQISASPKVNREDEILMRRFQLASRSGFSVRSFMQASRLSSNLSRFNFAGCLGFPLVTMLIRAPAMLLAVDVGKVASSRGTRAGRFIRKEVTINLMMFSKYPGILCLACLRGVQSRRGFLASSVKNWA